jgi:voltage-gated sodium channel
MPPPEKKKKDVAKKAVARTVNTRAVAVVKAKEQLASTNPLLADEQTKRKRLRERLLKRQYNVADFYFETGCSQRIARSTLFENMTFFIIFMNALWIAVDTDNNDANLIYDADTAYQAVENSFCTYFSIELLIRFLAFRKKRNCMKDFWFVFDGFLVVGMIVETWVVTGLYLFLGVQFGQSGGVGDLSVLRLMRVVKIFRMARMARLLRSVPELVMIMKGMGIAFRSVIFFVLLAVVVLYVFAVAFRQITKDTATGDKYFPTVPKAMGYLLLDGMLPIYAPIVNNVSEGGMYLWPIIMIFILLSSVTILNMLVGVLTEVVRNVAASEKDAMTVTHVTQQLRVVLGEFQKSYDIDETKSDAGEPTTRKKSLKRMMTTNIVPLGVGLAGDKVDESLIKLSKKDFEAFLTKPDVIKIIQDVGVDVVGLLDNAEVIYEDKDKEGTGLSFFDFIDVVLNLRGTNPATVKDIKETQRILKTDVQNARDKVRQYITKELSSIRSEMVDHFFHLEHKDSDSEDEVGTHSTFPSFPRDRSRPVQAFNVSENHNDSERSHERKVSFTSLDDDEVVTLPRDLMS